ncbi:hypothetical protein HK097_002508 [Rhizophlyctis rosea]|uniref:Arrestin-like N-terminal domain-containing protein n=1 Tax=Rhizophlyctis rosea TaxID=64517 RepID=A0AAD5S5I1_9FUNG|nr:hypothetical protein HK097_002508 [Rhizophlyctis rosea]
MGWSSKQPSLSIQPSPGFDHFIHGLHGATNPCLIKGVIHLTVSHELRSPRVLVRFSGKTKTGWLGNVDTRSNTVAAMAVWWTGPLNRISSDSHSEKRKLIDEKQIVFRDDDAYYGDALPTYDQARALTDQAPVIQNGTLQPGTYNLPFMFRVPGILPPSFQWKDGHISYYLQATVEYKEGFFGKLTRKKQTARVPLILE